jgi:hypothetical protein
VGIASTKLELVWQDYLLAASGIAKAPVHKSRCPENAISISLLLLNSLLCRHYINNFGMNWFSFQTFQH